MTSHPRAIFSRVIAALLVAVLARAAGTVLVAEPAPSSQDPTSCLQLVRAAVANEVAAAHNDSKHMFRSRKQTPQGSQTRLYVETREAMAGMTISYNDTPLSSEQMDGEQNRLAGLLSNPQQLSRKHAQEQATADRTLRILKAFPDAFLYDFDGKESGSGDLGKNGTQLVRLKFQPNPSYQPPSHVEQVLTGMHGVLVIDPEARRIARIDGTLFREVSFGWGILGHLDSGGRFLVEQQDVGNGCWELSRMTLAFTGRILIFKSLSINSDEIFSDFRSVPPDTTFAQGVQMLKVEEAKLAQNRSLETMKTETIKTETGKTESQSH
ncbi:MAG: hypothetical protein WB919_04295 [Candidatus Sulfotelmatobacter sp.]